MRIGDVGSISPTGELAAFAVAIAVVISLSTYLVKDDGESDPEGIDASDLRLISAWKGLDPDNDGILETDNGNLIVSMEKGPFPFEGRIGLLLEWDGSEILLLFNDRERIEDRIAYHIISEIHGISVLVNDGRIVVPGIVSIFLWEEER